jgi:hypothetical protein
MTTNNNSNGDGKDLVSLLEKLTADVAALREDIEERLDAMDERLSNFNLPGSGYSRLGTIYDEEDDY